MFCIQKHGCREWLNGLGHRGRVLRVSGGVDLPGPEGAQEVPELRDHDAERRGANEAGRQIHLHRGHGREGRGRGGAHRRQVPAQGAGHLPAQGAPGQRRSERGPQDLRLRARAVLPHLRGGGREGLPPEPAGQGGAAEGGPAGHPGPHPAAADAAGPRGRGPVPASGGAAEAAAGIAAEPRQPMGGATGGPERVRLPGRPEEGHPPLGAAARPAAPPPSQRPLAVA
mmetsp:Transcript_143/g.239  ORF Transcript_143/g.239 Transcript_143/m.239 type:complete len:227 (+) Transcript_143:513-1193(+)